MHPMEPLGGMGHMDFFLFGDRVCVGARSVYSLRQMHPQLSNRFRRTQWYSEVMRLKRELGLFVDIANLDSR
jgi:hypothetical protein